MVEAMAERTDRLTVVVPPETVAIDLYCPVCRTGYLGSQRFRADLRPPRGTVYHRGYCNPCRKWRWADSADGIPREQGRGGHRA